MEQILPSREEAEAIAAEAVGQLSHCSDEEILIVQRQTQYVSSPNGEWFKTISTVRHLGPRQGGREHVTQEVQCRAGWYVRVTHTVRKLEDGTTRIEDDTAEVIAGELDVPKK